MLGRFLHYISKNWFIPPIIRAYVIHIVNQKKRDGINSSKTKKDLNEHVLYPTFTYG